MQVDTIVYSNGHNAVEDFAFQLIRALPSSLIVYEQIDLEWVRARVRENPLVTLSGLSNLIHERFGVAPSISHMLRIQPTRLHLTHTRE